MNRKTLRATKLDERFNAALKARLEELGAEPGSGIGMVALLGGSYDLKISTIAGDLLISMHGDWVATRFVDVERAKNYLRHDFGSGELNPYSGKWNLHFDPETSVEDRLERTINRLRTVIVSLMDCHILLYNTLRTAIRVGDRDATKTLAIELHKQLKAAYATYGWNQLPLLGHEEIDGLIMKLDAFLMGARG